MSGLGVKIVESHIRIQDCECCKVIDNMQSHESFMIYVKVIIRGNKVEGFRGSDSLYVPCSMTKRAASI